MSKLTYREDLTKQYKLTKLSSGSSIYLETNEIYFIKQVLGACCCKDCIAEAVEETKGVNDDEETFVYNLLMTSCGAEFWLGEEEVEDEQNDL